MKKTDCFPFEFKNWLANKNIRIMTKKQRAEYIDLICYLACEGEKGIVDNEQELCRLLDSTPEDVKIIKQRLLLKDGFLFSKKLTELMKEKKPKEKFATNQFTIPKDLHPKDIVPYKKNLVIKSLQEFKDKYERELLNDFYLYWTEPTRDLTKIKMELEKTWDYELRLNNWYRNWLKKQNVTNSKPSKIIKVFNDNADAKQAILNANGK